MKINFDMDLLRTLIAFADTGSFKGASQLISRTQPTVSTQMKRLEEIVGVELFVKRGRDLAFTEKGSRFALQARQILALHDKVVDEWHHEKVTGEVRLGMPDDYAPVVLPKVLQNFAAKYHTVSLDISTNTSPVLIRMLNDGQIDIAVVATTAPLEDDVVLRREEIVWVASPDHETHKQSPLALALFSDESPIYRATLAALQRFPDREDGSPLQFRVGVTSKSCVVLTTVARQGYAVATMARSVVPEGLRILTEADGFPQLGQIALVLRGTPDSQSLATSHLAQEILDFFKAVPPAE